MTKDRAISLVHKLHALADKAGSAGEAAAAREQAAKLIAKFEIKPADLAAAPASSPGAPRTTGAGRPRGASPFGGVLDDELGEVEAFLADFQRKMRVTILVEGRKRGRFADHPHVDAILAAAAKRGSR